MRTEGSLRLAPEQCWHAQVAGLDAAAQAPRGGGRAGHATTMEGQALGRSKSDPHTPREIECMG